MIELENLSAWYGEVIAINDVTTRLDKPLVGLLGPNGAGKTTLLSILSGLRSPNVGEVRVNGHTPRNNPDALQHIGLVPEVLSPPPWLTGFRFVTDLARMSGVPTFQAERAARDMLAKLGLTGAMNRPIRGYSQGMKQRVKLAQALVHKPKVLLLDEPFTGLDPPARAMMTRVLQEVSKAGTQVVFSSHVLAEVEALTRDVIMLMRGRVAAQGTVREVRAALSAVPLRVAIQTPDPRKVARSLLDFGGVNVLEVRPTELLVHVAHGTSFFRELTRAGADLPVTGYGPADEDLESVYGLLMDQKVRG